MFRKRKRSDKDEESGEDGGNIQSSLAPGRYVRITKEQQAVVDAERERRAKRKEQIHQQPTTVKKIPVSARLYRSTLKCTISSHTPERISRLSFSEASIKIKHAETAWDKFQKEWLEIDREQFSEVELMEHSQFFADLENDYLGHRASLQEHCTERAEQTNMNSRGAPAERALQIQLTEPPKIPKFSGQEPDWTNFRTTFEAEVHNSSKLTDAQKMRYLLNALQGRAEQIYKNWPIGDGSSYTELWAEMCKQYGNQYNIIRAHLQTLENLKPLRQPSCETMRSMLDAARGAYRQLQLLLKPEEIGEYMMLHRLEGLLDQESRMLWSARRSVDELPRLSDMLKFLELRASLLSQSSASNYGNTASQASEVSKSPFERGQKFGRGDEGRPNCELCPGQTHWPFRCDKFKNLPLSERLAYITKQNRCSNCFSSRHHSTKCPERSCPRCQQKHNSILCPYNRSYDRPQSYRSRSDSKLQTTSKEPVGDQNHGHKQ